MREGSDATATDVISWLDGLLHEASEAWRMENNLKCQIAAAIESRQIDGLPFLQWVRAHYPAVPHSLRILVVDDNACALEMMAVILSARQGFDVTTADCGETAQARFAEGAFDIIVSNLIMPGMDGFQLLEWVRAVYPKTVRLLHTGFFSPAELDKGVKSGLFFRYLLLPFDPESILEFVEDAARAALAGRSFAPER
jgi:CheY-like chemotaxis protein